MLSSRICRYYFGAIRDVGQILEVFREFKENRVRAAGKRGRELHSSGWKQNYSSGEPDSHTIVRSG